MKNFNEEVLQNIAFQIILESGQGRTLINEAFFSMRNKDFVVAINKLEKAHQFIIRAHNVQNDLIQNYASCNKIEIDVLMVHAQDHLMSTQTLHELAFEMLFLHEQVANVI